MATCADSFFNDKISTKQCFCKNLKMQRGETKEQTAQKAAELGVKNGEARGYFHAEVLQNGGEYGQTCNRFDYM